MPSVLFVCTANLYRSPLAAAFLRDELKDAPGGIEWVIDSAGTWTSAEAPIPPQTIEDAHRFGLDVRNHKSKPVTAQLLSRYDLILVMETGHKEALRIEFPDQSKKVHMLSEVVDGLIYDIPDPFTREGNFDLDVANELHKIIKRGYKKIFSLAVRNSNKSTKKFVDSKKQD
jgi:protein-tyrosine phosphatase